MEKAVKRFCVLTLEKGYQAAVSEGFTFRPAFRKRKP